MKSLYIAGENLTGIRLPSTFKVKQKVHVWAGISYKGATDFAVFEKNLDSILYNDIMSNFLLPFMAIEYKFNCDIHQDNDPKHSSNLCEKYLRDNDINWVYLVFILFIYMIKRTLRLKYLDKITSIFTRSEPNRNGLARAKKSCKKQIMFNKGRSCRRDSRI